MPHWDTSVAIKQAINGALNVTQGHKQWLSNKPVIYLYQVPQARSHPVSFNEDTITLHCNQSGVLILTNVFEVYMLQVKLKDVITIPMSLFISHD